MNVSSDIKVLYINDWLKGSWQVQKIHAKGFLEAFKKQPGFQIFTFPPFSTSRSEDAPGMAVKHYVGFSQQSFKGIILSLLNRILSGVSYRRNSFAISRYIHKKQPDLIIARHNAIFFPTLYNLTKHQRPLILEVNALVAHGLSSTNIEVPSRIARLEQSILLRADALFAVCKTNSELIKEIGVDPGRVFTVPNGVDPIKFSPRPKSDELCTKYGLSNHLIIGFVGGFIKEEPATMNVLSMLEAFKIAKMKSGEPLKILMIGKIDKGYLWKEIKRLEITDSVVFTGFINHARVPEFMSLIDIAVAPYFERQLIDGSPIKLFEYMAMGKPTVIPGIGQPAKILKNKETAILIEPESAISMAEGLLILIQDKSLREKIGKNARELILKKYTWEHNARNIANICRLVLEKKNENQE
jgi:glycosyltransferase involved in cell wall biosynthesis